MKFIVYENGPNRISVIRATNVYRNEKLPESQRIPTCDLEIHPDITKDLDDTLQQEMDFVKQKYLFDVEKSRLGLQKLEDYFTNVLDSMTVYVCSIR
jgi:hypothetical protein